MDAVSNKQVRDEVRQLRREQRALFDELKVKLDRPGGQKSTDSLVEAAIGRLQVEGYGSSVFRRLTRAQLRNFSRRLLEHGNEPARRWLARSGVQIARSTVGRYASEVRAAIKAIEQGQPLKDRNRSSKRRRSSVKRR